MGLLDYVPGLGSGDEGGEGEIDGLTEDQLREDVDKDIEYSAERAMRVAEDASVYVNYDEQGSVALRSGFLMDGSSKRALKETFGDMLFGDDRENRTTLKMIQSEDGINYEEIGAATIGAGFAAAKVDEVEHTPYTPAYGDLFAEVVEGRWNMNPDVVSDIDENREHYEHIVQETAESVEQQLLEPRPHPEADPIEEELEREREEEGEGTVVEEELN